MWWREPERGPSLARAACTLALALAVLLPALPHADAHGGPLPPRNGHFRVNVQNNTYNPDPIVVKMGDHLNFTNLDQRQLHTITFDNLSFGNSSAIFPNKHWDWIPPAQGNFSFHCWYRHEMHGVVVVGPPPAPDAAPVVDITSPADGAKVAGLVEFTGSAFDPENDAFGLFVRYDGGAWHPFDASPSWSVYWNTTKLANGPHVLEVEGRDIWGVHGDTASRTIDVQNPTRTRDAAPTAVITAPLPNARLAGEVIVEGIGARTKSTGDFAVRVRVDQGQWKSATGIEHWSVPLDTRTVKDGPHAIEAVATEDGRNGPATKVNVLVLNAGTAQATIQILSPAERAKVNGTVTLRGLADDPDGNPLTIFSRVDGAEWKRASSGKTWSWAWNSSQYANGPHLIELYAATSERKSATAKVTLITDNGDRLERPTVSFISPNENERLSGVSLVRGRSNASYALPTVQVRLDDGRWETVSGSLKWAWTLNTTGLANGVHHLKARAFTDVGYSPVVERNVLVANAPAPLSPATPSPEESLVPATPKKKTPTESVHHFLPDAGAPAALALVAVAAWCARRRRLS